MTPLEFLSFRRRLESGSGFQSAQFREIEFALGHKSPRRKRQYSKLLVLTGKDARRLRRAAPYMKEKD